MLTIADVNVTFLLLICESKFCAFAYYNDFSHPTEWHSTKDAYSPHMLYSNSWLSRASWTSGKNTAYVKLLLTTEDLMCWGVSHFVGVDFDYSPLWLSSKGQRGGESCTGRNGKWWGHNVYLRMSHALRWWSQSCPLFAWRSLVSPRVEPCLWPGWGWLLPENAREKQLGTVPWYFQDNLVICLIE